MNIYYLDFDDVQNPLLGAGQATATYGAGKELAKLGHNVTVICSKYPGSKDRVDSGVTYKHIGLGLHNVQLNNLAYIFSLPFEVAKINSKNVDIIIECYTAPISTLFSPIFTKIPVVVLPSMFNAIEFSRKYHLPFYLVEKFGVKFYKYMMPYSQIDKAKMLSMNPHILTKIIPQGVSEECFKIQHKKAKHILFLSRFDIAQKGIDLLIESYAKIASDISFPLILAGHGPDEDKIRKMIEELGLTKKVKVVGSAYGAKKKRLLEESLFVVFPSRHDEMSLWALEALAAGQPIVGFDLPECGWAPSSVYIKVKPFDTTEYANTLLEFSKNKHFAETREKARQFARQFTWESVAKEFISFFKHILEIEKKC